MLKIVLSVAKIKATIAQIAREENVDISFGSCRYDSAKYNTTMTVKTKVITERVITVNDNTSKLSLIHISEPTRPY